MNWDEEDLNLQSDVVWKFPLCLLCGVLIQVEDKNFTQNCATVNVTTINGLYPGPTVEITEGDTVIAQVTNYGRYDVTIHW